MAPRDTAKKGALTLEKLAQYDDVLTDALVDKVRLTLQGCARNRPAPLKLLANRRICRSTIGPLSGRTAAVAFQALGD